jgi:hypothetical protein
VSLPGNRIEDVHHEAIILKVFAHGMRSDFPICGIKAGNSYSFLICFRVYWQGEVRISFSFEKVGACIDER